MNFKLIAITANIEKVVKEFTSSSYRDAHAVHVEAWKQKKVSHSIVLEDEIGRRYSYVESVKEVSRPIVNAGEL